MLISDRRNRLGDDIIEASVDLWGNGIRHGTDGTDAEGSCFTVRIIVISFIYCNEHYKISMDVDKSPPGTAQFRYRPSPASVPVPLPNDGTVSVLTSDGRLVPVPSHPKRTRTDRTVEDTNNTRGD